jgi:hypothetical protein
MEMNQYRSYSLYRTENSRFPSSPQLIDHSQTTVHLLLSLFVSIPKRVTAKHPSRRGKRRGGEKGERQRTDEKGERTGLLLINSQSGPVLLLDLGQFPRRTNRIE